MGICSRTVIFRLSRLWKAKFSHALWCISGEAAWVNLTFISLTPPGQTRISLLIAEKNDTLCQGLWSIHGEKNRPKLKRNIGFCHKIQISFKTSCVFQSKSVMTIMLNLWCAIWEWSWTIGLSKAIILCHVNSKQWFYAYYLTFCATFVQWNPISGIPMPRFHIVTRECVPFDADATTFDFPGLWNRRVLTFRLSVPTRQWSRSLYNMAKFLSEPYCARLDFRRSIGSGLRSAGLLSRVSGWWPNLAMRETAHSDWLSKRALVFFTARSGKPNLTRVSPINVITTINVIPTINVIKNQP